MFLAKIKEYAKLSSAHFALLTAMIPLTGAIVMGETDALLLLKIFTIGILVHIYGFAFNHYNDIEVDRLTHKLKERPLVSGIIKKRNALIYILGILILAFLLTLSYFDIVVVMIFLLGIILATLYDVLSKKISGMDLILGASVVVGAIFGSATVSTSFTKQAYMLWILAFIQTLNLNLIAGGLKDADHDWLSGSKHLSTRLGVKVENGRFIVPKSFKVIAFFLGVLYTFFVFVPIVLRIFDLNHWLVVLLIFVNLAFLSITYQMVNLNRFNRKEVRKYVVLQYNINWFNIPILLVSINLWAGLLVFIPLFGLIVSNILLYQSVFRPKTM